MCVCVCVCVRLCVYLCVHVCKCARVHSRACVLYKWIKFKNLIVQIQGMILYVYVCVRIYMFESRLLFDN